MNLSIRWKLATAYFVLVVLILGIADLFLLRFLEREYLQDKETTYLANANIIATAGINALLEGDRNAYYLARSFGTHMGTRVIVLDQKGVVKVDSFGEGWLEGRALDYNEVLSALRGNAKTGVHITEVSERVLYVAVPLVKEKATAGAVLLVVGLDDMYAMLNQVRGIMMLVSIGSGLLAALLSVMLAGFFTRPLKELTGAVKQMTRGRLEQRINVRSGDELGHLAGAFNEMSMRLSQVERTRHRFLADASHELKSPLSSIKALAQSLIDTGEKDPAIYREYMEDINIETDRLARIVDNMLQLTRLEEDENTLQMEKEKIYGLVNHVFTLMQPRAESQGVELKAELDKDLVWPVNRDLLTRILINLVDNAIRHTPPGGEIKVQSLPEKGGMVIRVSDTGEGIPAGDIPRIFDRFYRVDKARSRTSGGTGLGLAIVRQAVNRHGGEITVTSKQGEGTTIEMFFPPA